MLCSALERPSRHVDLLSGSLSAEDEIDHSISLIIALCRHIVVEDLSAHAVAPSLVAIGVSPRHATIILPASEQIVGDATKGVSAPLITSFCVEQLKRPKVTREGSLGLRSPLAPYAGGRLDAEKLRLIGVDCEVERLTPR